MINHRFSILFFAFIVALASPGAAADKKAGTSGAAFLKIGAGARPTAMGSAFVGIADDVNATHFNPAGLAYLDRVEFTAMHTQWLQGMNYEFGALSVPFRIGTLAISATTLKTDELERRSADESFQGTFENLDSAYGLSYAKKLDPSLSLGLTARLIRQKIDSVSADTWSGDGGVFKRFSSLPMTAGFAVRHVGQSVTFREEGDPLPLTYDLGFGYALFNDRLLMGLNGTKPRDTGVKFGIGSEWKDQLRGPRTRYALRVGYNSAGTDADGTTGLTLGAGLGFDRLDLDFAWIPFGDLGNTLRYSAKMRF